MLEETERKSKTQVKKEMLALQALGERLAELSSDRIKKIEVPVELRDALLMCKTIGKGEARRRQLQYIGALMREADTEPIEKALDALDRGDRQGELRFKELERWRDALIDGNDDLMGEILGRFPGADRQTLRQLVLNARKEREGQRPPKASRALFRFLIGLSKLV
jgi:ribosome-associated protein